jgi:IS5 family transposase
MEDNIDVNDLLGHMTADELRALADGKDRRAEVQPMIDGLRELAKLVEQKPEALSWTRRSVGLDYMQPWSDGRPAFEWMVETMIRLGGEWEQIESPGLEDYTIMRRQFSEHVRIDLTMSERDQSALEKYFEALAAGDEPPQLAVKLVATTEPDDPAPEREADSGPRLVPTESDR